MESEHLIHHQETRGKLAVCLEEQDSKIVSILVWCSIALLCSYLVILLEAIIIYSDVGSGHRWYMIPGLMLLFLPFVVIAWKVFSYAPRQSRAVAKGLFHWNVAEHNRELRWLSGLVIVYFFIVQVSCFSLWHYAGGGLTLLAGIILYGLGLFLLVKLACARKTIVNYLRLTDRHLYQRRTAHS